MPKNEIDYSNTIIYKIFCKDKSISDMYVGHTTSFIKRKYQHKLCCNNLNNKLKIYDTIRANGGWDNWEMIQIANYNCKNSEEARIKEQEHYEELEPTLNSSPPYSDMLKSYCYDCNLQCSSLHSYNIHITSISHKKKSELYIISNKTKDDGGDKKTQKKYNCSLCDFNADNKKDFNKHILTGKHKRNYNDYKKDDIMDDDKILKNQVQHICECGKAYHHRQGLWKHKKNCTPVKYIEPQNSELKILTNLVLDVVKQNKELTQQNSELTNKIVDICKTGQTNNSISNSNINSNNKTFNLNVFLNETCKDAMNIMEFVDSLKLQLSDLESVGRLGYVEGISNIIVKNLKQLDVHKRPVHCSDSKREVMYIKDEDKWEKENEENKKLRKVIKKIADKNARLIPEFKKEHPDCVKSVSKYSDQYNKLIVESMGGSGDNDSEKEDKIIKKIAKNVVIDKTIELID